MTTYTLEYEHFNVEVEEVVNHKIVCALILGVYFKGILVEYLFNKSCVINPEQLDEYISKLHKKCEIMAIIVSFEKRYGSCYNEIDAIGEDDYEEMADKLSEVLI